jgi:hypothetical protein
LKENNIKNIWTVGNYDPEKVRELVEKLSLKEFLAKVLVAKGFDTPEKADEYLNSSINSLADPFLLKDMDKAVAVVIDSFKHGESSEVKQHFFKVMLGHQAFVDAMIRAFYQTPRRCAGFIMKFLTMEPVRRQSLAFCTALTAASPSHVSPKP